MGFWEVVFTTVVVCGLIHFFIISPRLHELREQFLRLKRHFAEARQARKVEQRVCRHSVVHRAHGRNRDIRRESSVAFSDSNSNGVPTLAHAPVNSSPLAQPCAIQSR